MESRVKDFRFSRQLELWTSPATLTAKAAFTVGNHSCPRSPYKVNTLSTQQNESPFFLISLLLYHTLYLLPTSAVKAFTSLSFLRTIHRGFHAF